MEVSGMLELGAVRARFATVAARWALDAPTAARLLGLEGEWSGRLLLELLVRLDVRGETSMRLVCEVDRLLDRLVEPEHVVGWLRTPGVGYEDELLTPLEAMSSGPSAIRGLRSFLQNLPPRERCLRAV